MLSANEGKNNPIIVKCLIKVVIDDIKYEIFCTQEYVDSLKDNIKRLEKAEKYYNKMKSAKNQEKEQYFYEYTMLYLEKGEDINNFLTIKQEYKDAYERRKGKVDTLYDEIKKIKKLKVW